MPDRIPICEDDTTIPKNLYGDTKLAVEVMLNTKLVAELIEKGDFSGVKEAMEKSMADGSQTFEQAIAKLIVDELWALRHEVEERLAEGRVVDLWGQHSDATWLRPQPLQAQGRLAERPLRMYGKARTGY